MPRSRNTVCLQDGLKLDLNSLARKGFVKRGSYSGLRGIGWTHSYWGEVASALISADLSDTSSGWLKLEGGLNQFILLAAQARRFGGHQWYFICPGTGRLASVLWRPPGATRFCSRQARKCRVAYATQFLDRDSRAHHAKSRINARLCSIGKLDPEEWDFPPKPKWMRWKTYRRYETRFDHYDDILDRGIVALALKLGLK
ncbi:hypothetical protein [Bradyrhizobium jicamae]|uniref:hypothetical protein n=1 Tax=Bradyrhizobium jicamae TaxID=280332 RepID=UPI000AFFA56E|nr:hypothetical protein [Bradyrhizobium jicamae]